MHLYAYAYYRRIFFYMEHTISQLAPPTTFHYQPTQYLNGGFIINVLPCKNVS